MSCSCVPLQAGCAVPFLGSCAVVYAGAEGAAETLSHWGICPYALAFSRVKTAANPAVVDRKYTFLTGMEYYFLN